jgi:hypothetical protein
MGLNGGEAGADLKKPSVGLNVCRARDYGDVDMLSSGREDSLGPGLEA